MDTELMLDVGQANELKLAFRRGGWTNADIKRFCEGNIAERFLPAVKGLAKIVAAKYLIDCDAIPFTPEDWRVVSHKMMGQFEWDPAKIRLHLSHGQQNNEQIQGFNLERELKNEPVLNANVLDYLMDHRELIPEEWKNQNVFFWGTIYGSPSSHLNVNCLNWYAGYPAKSYRSLCYAWYHADPAVCLQVSS